MLARPKQSVATRVACVVLSLAAIITLTSPGTAARRARHTPPAAKKQAKPRRGMHVLDLATGEHRWFRADCYPMASADVNHTDCLVVTKERGRAVALLRAKDGKVLWQWRAFKQPVSGSRVEGGRLYVAAGKEVRCADVATGHTLWSRRVTTSGSTLGGARAMLALSSTSFSPLGVYRGMLALSSAQGVTFLEEKSGKLLDAITLPKISEYAKVSATWALSGGLLVAGQANIVTATNESGETWQQ